MNNMPLGLKVATPISYDPSVLFRIERESNEQKGKVYGGDLWSCYETSFLNSDGIPTVGILRWALPSSSKFIVESKSFKLFLGSCNFKKFDSNKVFVATIKEKLAELLETNEIEINYFTSEQWSELGASQLPGTTIDNQHIPTPSFDYAPELLKTEESRTSLVSEALYSDLLRSLCPVTAQPDWATVQINYTGKQICKKSLLSYICSLRNHQGFHESLCQLIYDDIQSRCAPAELTVTCFFTRRGGVDITPVRSSVAIELRSQWLRTIRQ